jgi:hypothetical protein
MSFRVIFAVLTGLVTGCNSALADPMTLDFSWRGARGCVSLFPNPEIRLRNIPADGRFLSLTLTQGLREMGGQELPIPEDGILPFGTIRTFGPCSPGVYRWTAMVKSSTGQVLSEAHQARFYPTDELTQEKP